MENVQIILEKDTFKVLFKKTNFDEQWKDYKRKLQQLTCLCKGKPEVFFHFPCLEMNIILNCLNEIKNDCEVIGYQNKIIRKEEFKIIQHKIRGGEEIIFNQGGLIVGNIEKDVCVTLMSGNLYVLGIVKGRIDCLSNKSKIFCQKMQNARIAYQGNWQISTKNESIVIYDKTMHDCGGKLYGKKNNDYQW